MKHEQALAIAQTVIAEADSPVSVFVADAHGEVVAAATMDGAAPDTRLNAQRKAYTAARSDALSTRELAEKVRGDPGRARELRPVLHVLPRAASPRSTATRAGRRRRRQRPRRAPTTMPWRARRSHRSGLGDGPR